MTQDDADPLDEEFVSGRRRRKNGTALAARRVCRSYHAIDDFRTKLLGVLPIASLAGSWSSAKIRH